MDQERQKPSCPLIGQNGNIFHLMGLASRTLRQCGMADEAKEMQNRIMGGDCHSYEEALRIISEYVETELSSSISANNKRRRIQRMSDNQKWEIIHGDALKVLSSFAPGTLTRSSQIPRMPPAVGRRLRRASPPSRSIRA